MSDAKLLNHTSTVAASRTVEQIQRILGEHGADAIMVRYTDRKPSGVTFTITGPHGPRAFTLPVDVTGVFKALNSSRSIAPRYRTREQAERTAWRIVKDWLEAQLALIEAQMATLEMVMLPYMHTDAPGAPTVWDRYLEAGPRALAGGES